VTLAGAALALAALLVPRLRPRFPMLAVGAVTVDLFLLGVRYHPPVPARLDLAPPPTVAWLMERQAAAREPYRVSFEDFDLPPNLNALYGLWDPRGYDPMRPEDAARMVGWWLGHRRRFYQNIGDSLPALDQAAHDFLAVRYLETAHERALPPPWRLVFEGKGGRVWENPAALPLFFMPRTIERSADLAEAQRAAMYDDDFLETAQLVGAAAPGPAGPAPAAPSSGARAGAAPGALAPGAEAGESTTRPQDGRVRDIRVRSNGFDLAVDSAAGGIVASSVSYAPEWRAAVGGREEPAVEIDGGFLGFQVPPGSHAVRLRYRPPGWTAGLALFAAGCALSLAAWWGRRRGWRTLAWLEPASPSAPGPPAAASP
jgi:hypothetical protein